MSRSDLPLRKMSEAFRRLRSPLEQKDAVDAFTDRRITFTSTLFEARPLDRTGGRLPRHQAKQRAERTGIAHVETVEIVTLFRLRGEVLIQRVN